MSYWREFFTNPPPPMLFNETYQSPDDRKLDDLLHAYAQLSLDYQLALKVLRQVKYNLENHGDGRAGKAAEVIGEFLDSVK